MGKKNFNVNSHTGLPVGLILDYSENNLNFVCSGVFLTASEELRYRFFLEGFDAHWSPLTKSNFANYSNIPPGKYVFKVQATANGYDYTMPVTLSFEIKAPFYKTIWAYIFISLPQPLRCSSGIVTVHEHLELQKKF